MTLNSATLQQVTVRQRLENSASAANVVATSFPTFTTDPKILKHRLKSLNEVVLANHKILNAIIASQPKLLDLQA